MDILKISGEHHEQWLGLYRQYADFYKVELSAESAETTWGWLLDAAHPCTGIVAVEGGKLVGLAHFRPMPSPLRGCDIGFLDDLFVSPDCRGSGAARQLIDELRTIAKTNGWPVVRWITRDHNYRARAFYDRFSTKTDWNTYEMSV